MQSAKCKIMVADFSPYKKTAIFPQKKSVKTYTELNYNRLTDYKT